MKSVLLFFLVAMLSFSCTTQQPMTRIPDDNLIVNSEDQEEYELLIIDPGFSTWFITNAKPITYYSKSYYESKNRLYVSAWNELSMQYGGNSPFENRIYYDPQIDYGIELNYQLFWYFKYIESQYGRYYNFPT